MFVGQELGSFYAAHLARVRCDPGQPHRGAAGPPAARDRVPGRHPVRLEQGRLHSEEASAGRGMNSGRWAGLRRAPRSLLDSRRSPRSSRTSPVARSASSPTPPSSSPSTPCTSGSASPKRSRSTKAMRTIKRPNAGCQEVLGARKRGGEGARERGERCGLRLFLRSRPTHPALRVSYHPHRAGLLSSL